ncbi:hypothetical protein Agub_g3149, partial [Astrephomene gubernaculifera]
MASKALLLALLGAVAVLGVTAEELSTSGRSLLATGFPYCACDNKAKHSPYRLTTAPSVSYMGQTWMCFTLYLNATGTSCSLPAGSRPACCDANLYKLEFDVDPACKGTSDLALLFKGYNTVVDGVTIQETVKTISIEVLDRTPAAAVLRISKGLEMPQAVLASFSSGLPVCFNRKPGFCTTTQLFMSPDSATYALFNTNKNCCPSGLAGPLNPPDQPKPNTYPSPPAAPLPPSPEPPSPSPMAGKRSPP